MIASKNTQSDGTAAPRLLDVLREALRGAYSLPTEAVHQLDAALALSPSSVPNWPAHDTAIECRLCFRPQPMISMKSTGHFGRSVDTKVIKSKGRKPSGCGLHSFGVEQVLLGLSGHSCIFTTTLLILLLRQFQLRVKINSRLTAVGQKRPFALLLKYR